MDHLNLTVYSFKENIHRSVKGLFSKTCPKRPLKKKTKNGFQDQLSLNAFDHH